MSEDQYNYPRNSWWVAALSEDLTDKPIGRWLLDQPIALYRTQAKQVVALEDRCPHRWAPLSEGRILNDTLMCRYHGARFGPDGQCVAVATQSAIPPGARVKSYPVAESEGFVWIWMGDPDAAQHEPVPLVGFAGESGWRTTGGHMQADMNYFFIQENVLDLTHFGFVHADLMDQVGWNDGDLQTIVKDNTVTFRKEFDGAPLPPFVSLALGMDPATNVKRVDWGTMVNPGTHTAGIEFRHDGAKTFWGSEDLSWRIAHMTTPITHNRCHYWWRTGYSFGNVDDNMLQSIRATLIRAFNQDKDLLEKVQYLIDHDSRGIHSTEVSFRADRPALRARAILMKMLSTERKKTA